MTDSKLLLPDKKAGSKTNLVVAKLFHGNYIWIYMQLYAFINIIHIQVITSILV